MFQVFKLQKQSINARHSKTFEGYNEGILIIQVLHDIPLI